MGKEKELLKAINANLELIMQHLNIQRPDGADKKESKHKNAAKKGSAKRSPAKKAASPKK